jgi:hypothetical protein
MEFRSVKPTVKNADNVTHIIQSSASRTKVFTPIDPSSELLGYCHSSA